MRKLTDQQRAITDRQIGVSQMYKTAQFTTEQIAKNYGISVREVQRIAHKYGVIRTQAEANRVAAPLKKYHTVPLEFRVKRKQLSNRTRYDLLALQPFCTLCGRRAEDGVRLEVDHIDNDPTNNRNSNLQILCALCNTGKYHSSRDYN
jgi:5-methylcytosine-specific restriction endonuclease McrA